MSFLTMRSGQSTRCHSIGSHMPVRPEETSTMRRILHQLSRGTAYTWFVWIWYDYTCRTKLLLVEHDEMT